MQAVLVRIRFVLLVATVAGLGGCVWWGEDNPCESAEEYQRSASVPPIVVPAGLEKPDDSGRLVVPDGPLPAEPLEKTAACLQQPPNYFDKPVYVPTDD
jgi:uncharacterized lipoprotein